MVQYYSTVIIFTEENGFWFLLVVALLLFGAEIQFRSICLVRLATTCI